MKKVLFLWMALVLVTPVIGQAEFFDLTDTFFKKYVDEDGMVAYTSIKSNPQILNDLYTQIGDFNLQNEDPNMDQAFLINAYNILAIKQVVDLFPINGPLEDERFFNGIEHQVAGTMMTLDQLEKETLFRKCPDSRLHFVLVCAAKSCPPLRSGAYYPSELDAQIENRTRMVLNLPSFILVNKSTVELSEIFNWYKDDFGGTDEAMLNYVNNYRLQKIKARKVGYYDYNWSLNKQDI